MDVICIYWYVHLITLLRKKREPNLDLEKLLEGEMHAYLQGTYWIFNKAVAFWLLSIYINESIYFSKYPVHTIINTVARINFLPPSLNGDHSESSLYAHNLRIRMQVE